MAFENLTVEELAFLVGSFVLGWGLYQESGAGLLLLLAVLVLVTAPEEEE